MPDMYMNPQQTMIQPTAQPTGGPRRHQWSTDDIPAGSVAVIKGFVGWNRISSLINGQELQRKIAREQSNPNQRYVTTTPHTSIRVYNAQVLQIDPNQKSPFEMFLEERFYSSQNADYPGNNWSIDNKSQRLPNIGVVDANNPNIVNEIKLPSDLANGTPVRLLLRVYASTKGRNGISLDSVIIDTPNYELRSYSNTSSGWAQYGIQFNAMPAEPAESGAQMDMSAYEPQQFAPVETAPAANVPVQQPYQQMPMQQPYQQVPTGAATAIPAQQMPQQAGSIIYPRPE